PEQALRQFELALLHHLGYGLDFLHCAGSGLPVDDAMTYLNAVRRMSWRSITCCIAASQASRRARLSKRSTADSWYGSPRSASRWWNKIPSCSGDKA
ncbi:DNA repair protein RecO C-terminal domain-containing protein, partial [Serratia marcescens]|uniref:DNA repair protein RecO C-terminal domain-containing protein n=1 Tax=Serratia marcescens TaxID=615 RepID=UPI0028144B89